MSPDDRLAAGDVIEFTVRLTRSPAQAWRVIVVNGELHTELKGLPALRDFLDRLAQAAVPPRGLR